MLKFGKIAMFSYFPHSQLDWKSSIINVLLDSRFHGNEKSRTFQALSDRLSSVGMQTVRSHAGAWEREYFLPIIFCLFSILPLNSNCSTLPDASQIKSSPELVYGEGTDPNQEHAREISESDLLKKIQVSLTVSTSSLIGETGGSESRDVMDEYIRDYHSFSSLNLKELKRSEYKKGNEWYVISYITRDNLSESIELRKQNIRGFVKSASQAIENGNIGEALRNYYWGYLLAKTSLDTIEMNTSISHESSDPHITLTNLLIHTLQNIEIKSDECYRDGREIIVPIEFRYKNRKASGISYSYHDGINMSYGLADDGNDRLTIYDEPIEKSRIQWITIEYTYKNEMQNDPEIRELFKIFEESVFNNKKAVNLTFPWIEGETITSPKAQNKSSDMENAMDKFPEAILVLTEKQSWMEFMDVLSQYQKLGYLSSGKQNDFGDGEGCYVAIADQEKVMDILFFNDGVYQVVDSGARYNDLSDQYSGMIQIWIKALK